MIVIHLIRKTKITINTGHTKMSVHCISQRLKSNIIYIILVQQPARKFGKQIYKTRDLNKITFAHNHLEHQF